MKELSHIGRVKLSPEDVGYLCREGKLKQVYPMLGEVYDPVERKVRAAYTGLTGILVM